MKVQVYLPTSSVSYLRKKELDPTYVLIGGREAIRCYCNQAVMDILKYLRMIESGEDLEIDNRSIYMSNFSIVITNKGVFEFYISDTYNKGKIKVNREDDNTPLPNSVITEEFTLEEVLQNL